MKYKGDYFIKRYGGRRTFSPGGKKKGPHRGDVSGGH